MLKVEYYSNARGDYPVVIFIENISNAKAQTKIFRALQRIEIYSIAELLKSGEVKKMPGYSNLYELKIRYINIRYRIMFTILDNTCWMLSAFIKKDQKTRPKEIRKALQLINNLNKHNF